MFNKQLIIIICGILCVLASFASDSWQKSINNRKTLCILLCVLFIIQAGFRDWMYQLTDTINYYNSYEALKTESFSNLFKSFSFIAREYEGRDPGFKIFVKLTQLIWSNFTFFLVLTATIVCIPIWRFVYRITPTVSGIFLAACLYESLFAPFFETGIRQTITMGLEYFALLAFLNKRKTILVILLVLVAYTIHKTAIIFVPIFFLLRIKRPRRVLIWALLLAPVFMVFAKPIIAFVGSGTIFDSYAVNSESNLGTPVFSIFVFLSVIATIAFSKRIASNCNDFTLLFVCMSMALMLTPTSWVDSNFIRLVFYYLVFLMPLMSVIVENSVESKDLKPVLYGLLSIIFVLL